jgi:hypothetical protein
MRKASMLGQKLYEDGEGNEWKMLYYIHTTYIQTHVKGYINK